MTTLCGGGSSGPQSGVGGVLAIGAAAIEAFIAGVLELPALAPVLAPIIAGGLDITIASYCATDPPADPGLTAGILEDAVRIPPTLTTFQSIQKCIQWFESRYWYQICQCTSTATPAPSAPSNPGQVSTNPGLPTQSTACWNVSIPFNLDAPFNLSFSTYTDLTRQGLPAGDQVTVSATTPTTGFNVTAVSVPSGITNVKLTHVLDVPVQASSGSVQFFMQAYKADGTVDGTNGLEALYFGPAGPNTIIDFRQTLDPVATHWAVYVRNNDTIAHSGTIGIEFFCPAGTSVGQQCCAPDPLLEGLLQQILQYAEAIYAGIPVPVTSFAESTVHSGLTGNGSITFADLPIALKVVLTTIPSWVGVESGSPNFYFDVGFLTLTTSEGGYEQVRISLQQQIVTVPLLAGSLGFTLKNGVVASITELVRGP